MPSCSTVLQIVPKEIDPVETPRERMGALIVAPLLERGIVADGLRDADVNEPMLVLVQRVDATANIAWDVPHARYVACGVDNVMHDVESNARIDQHEAILKG
jgi:hypothetical protein